MRAEKEIPHEERRYRFTDWRTGNEILANVSAERLSTMALRWLTVFPTQLKLDESCRATYGQETYQVFRTK